MAQFRPVLHFPFRQRLVRIFAQLRRRFFWDHWFPHIAIAVAVAVFGLINFLDGLARIAPNFPGFMNLKPVLHLGQIPAFKALAGIPQGLAGAVLMVMAIGLAFRSRFAWAVTLLLAAATMALIIHHGGLHWGSLVAFNGLLLVAILIFHRDFAHSSLTAGTLFGVISVVLLLGYAVFGSYILGAGFSPPITKLPTALYFSVVTLSTVGYGDIVPKTVDARMFVVSVIILGITVFATSISAVIVPLVNGRMQRLLAGEKKRMKQNHYIITGDNALAHNTYRELKARHLPVLVLLAAPPTTSWVDADDLMIGDASDSETLRKAGGADALAILALRADDSENAFIVLAAKEIGGKARTVAAVKNSKNLARVRRVGPDLVIAPDILGGEVLAMALNGETLNSESILRNMFQGDAKS